MYKRDSAHSNKSLQDKLSHIYTLRGGPVIDLTIRPAYYTLLERLGNPHKNLPPTIHVAGTNGKGSTIAFLKAILESAGASVHTYTSPHLLSFNERICLAGIPISDTLLEKLLDEVLDANGTLPLTFFEITTALAFLAFARTPADILILETGLGGRLDCTNVIENPIITIITPIGMDHAEFLGETLTRIATEKAGIMKPGVNVVSAPQVKEAHEALKLSTTQKNCRFYDYNTTWRIAKNGSNLTLHWDAKTVQLCAPALPGEHQIYNAGTAIMALLACEESLPPHIKITEKDIVNGLNNAHWPARLQKLNTYPDKKIKNPAWEIWLDGGHNALAAETLAKQLDSWRQEDPEKPVHLVLGMMKTKDPEAFIRHLAPYLSSITAIPVPGEEERSHTAKDISACLQGQNIPVSEEKTPEIAVNLIMNSDTAGRILIAGSLYLAGHVLNQI